MQNLEVFCFLDAKDDKRIIIRTVEMNEWCAPKISSVQHIPNSTIRNTTTTKGLIIIKKIIFSLTTEYLFEYIITACTITIRKLTINYLRSWQSE